MNTHRQYIHEQIRKEPKFAEALAKADHEVGIAMELAKFMSSLFLTPHGGADALWRAVDAAPDVPLPHGEYS